MTPLPQSQKIVLEILCTGDAMTHKDIAKRSRLLAKNNSLRIEKVSRKGIYSSKK